MHPIRVKGGFRASAMSNASAATSKCARFLLVPFIIRFCTSVPIALQPISDASSMVVPVPQNGSKTVSPVLACARLTMHLASFAFIAEG